MPILLCAFNTQARIRLLGGNSEIDDNIVDKSIRQKRDQKVAKLADIARIAGVHKDKIENLIDNNEKDTDTNQEENVIPGTHTGFVNTDFPSNEVSPPLNMDFPSIEGSLSKDQKRSLSEKIVSEKQNSHSKSMEKRRVSDGDRIEPIPYGTTDLGPLLVDTNTVDRSFSAKFDTNDVGGDNDVDGGGDGGDKRGDDDGENNDKDKEVSRGDTDAVEDVILNIDKEIGIDGESEIGTGKEVEVEAVTEIGVDSETVKGEEQGERFLYSIFINWYIFIICTDMHIHVFIRSTRRVSFF